MNEGLLSVAKHNKILTLMLTPNFLTAYLFGSAKLNIISYN